MFRDFVFAFLYGGCSLAALAQPITLLEGTPLSLSCYSSARQAATEGLAHRQDLADCDRAIAHSSMGLRDLAATYTNRGVLNLTMLDLDNAENDFRRALDFDQDMPEIYVNLGNLAFMRRDYSQSLDYYGRAEQGGFQPSSLLMVNRGMVNFQLGRVEEAAALYRQAQEAAPLWELPTKLLEEIDAWRESMDSR